MKTPACPDASLPLPAGIDTSVDTAAGVRVPVRVYGTAPSASDALVIHFHGGNFLAGSIDCGATVAGLLVQAGAVVVSMAYPLACTQPFPAALEASHAVLGWAGRERRRLAGKHARLFLAGEEAGANLAAALAMLVRDQRCSPLAGQILISPMLDPRVGTASMRARQAAEPGCPWADGWRAYLDCGMAADHPYALPARAMRLADLAPALIVTAEDDPLRDEAQAYAARLSAAGTPADCQVLRMATGWPCRLREPDADAAWIAPVRDLVRDFLQPDNRPAATP